MYILVVSTKGDSKRMIHVEHIVDLDCSAAV